MAPQDLRKGCWMGGSKGEGKEREGKGNWGRRQEQRGEGRRRGEEKGRGKKRGIVCPGL